MYLAGSLLCVGGLAGLAHQKTAPVGNAMGMMGVTTRILSTSTNSNIIELKINENNIDTYWFHKLSYYSEFIKLQNKQN